MASDKVSVIMSVYNEEIGILREAIESILNQSYKNIQFIIIIDNPGYEDAKKILNEYSKEDKRIEIIENYENIGLVNSLNKGLKLANGEFIARMDADDLAHKDRIKIQLESIYKFKCDFITSRSNVINENGEFLYKVNNSSLNYKKSNKILGIKCIHFHPTWFFKREILDTIGEYNHRDYVEDYDFLCRVAINGFKIITIPEYILDVRVREKGITKSNIYEQYLNSKLIRKAFKKAIKNNDINIYESILDKGIEVNIDEKSKYINQFNTYKEMSTKLKNERSINSILSFSLNLLFNKYGKEEFFRNMVVKINSLNKESMVIKYGDNKEKNFK